MNSRTSKIKDAFIASLGNNPDESPTLSQVSDIIDEFAKNGYKWGNIRDHHESFADFRYLNCFSESGGPNIIRKYLDFKLNIYNLFIFTGLTFSMIYVSPRGSITSYHLEFAELYSANVVIVGTKLWMVSPMEALDPFLKAVNKYQLSYPGCSNRRVACRSS